MLTKQQALDILCEEYGDIESMMQEAMMDSTNCGICLNCEEITDPIEPDCHAGRCPECGTRNLYSFTELVLF